MGFTNTATTIEHALRTTDNRPSGFDYMRVILAAGVVLAHSRLLTGDLGPRSETSIGPYIGFVSVFLVPMFFALSGFLVAGSLERCRTLPGFLALRVIRIAPALAVEVFLSALILGTLLTAFSYKDYFSDRLFFLYFLNMIGEVQYKLPGLFLGNPVTVVNGQIWTVPYELLCYVVLSAIAVAGMYKARKYLLVVLALFCVAQIINTIYRPNAEFGGAGGSTAVMCFVAGLTVYRFRDKIPYSAPWCLIAVIFSYFIVFFQSGIPNGMRFAALPIAYFTVYLGLLNPARNIVLSGDYSYGIYLYGFPVQQAVVQLLPMHREWYWNLVVALPVVIVIAVLSWWLVEKPCLARRSLIQIAEDRRASRHAVEAQERA